MVRCLNCGKKILNPKYNFCYECHIVIGNDLNYLTNTYDKMQEPQNTLEDYEEEYEPI